jgi:asparagine synthase (glutamine-hydrolysing)
MSAHAGVFLRDGSAVDDREAAIHAALSPLAPDGVSLYANDSIVMGFGECRVWSEDGPTPLPCRSPSGLIGTWDGRLDNREDLRVRLGLGPSVPASDAAIALAAFERWGIDGLRPLVGEWSVVIWDPRSRVLHLARDYMGIRPLFYCATDREVLWSSSLGDLARRSGRDNAISETFVAGFMTFRFSGEITPYDGIHAVPAATCVSFSAHGDSWQRYWQLEPATIRYRDPHQYEEHLRALWQESVGARLRTNQRVWAELSGGLDSSSVVCVADWLMKRGQVRARGIQPVSHVTLDAPEGDERRFIAQVEAQIGERTEILGVEANESASEPDWEWVTPLAASGVGLAQHRLIRARGGRLVLSGRAGDVVMGCEPDNSIAVFDDLAGGHVLAALANVRRWCRASRKPFVDIARKLVSRSTASRAARAIEHGSSHVDEGVDLLMPRLAGLTDRFDGDLASELARVRAAKRDLWAMMHSYAAGSRLNIPYASGPIVHTYPFTHRPLVEFVIAIPGVELSAPGEMRSLMRRAFAGLVPSRVLQRTSKGYYPPSATRAARPLAAALRPVDRLEVVRRGWVDPVKLDAAIGRMLDARDGGTAVRSVIRLEQWLVSRSQRPAAAISKGKEVRSHEVLEA